MEKIVIRAGTNHDEVIRLANLGVSKLPPNENTRGHHFVHFKVKIQTHLSSQAKKLLQEYAKLEPEIEDEQLKAN